MLIQTEVSLAPLTTLAVGGPARYFCEAQTEDDIRDAVVFARERELPLFILGGGSNLVVSDRGFDGLVLKIALRGVEQPEASRALFEVAAGEEWDAFVARSVEGKCAGIECLSGIPGTVGGTPVQNVGAYGQEVAETITEVRAVDLDSLESVTLASGDCGFSYRASRFNTADRNRFVITRVTFALRPNGVPCLRYADLQKHFDGHSTVPTLAEVRHAVREIRHSKAMLIVPGDDDARSAGSFFKNPVIPAAQYERLVATLSSRSLQLLSYPAGEGMRKVSAAWLVEHAGFAKGYVKGAAGISRRHALAIVNRGGATAAEIMALKDKIQACVLGEFGIQLQPEPVFVGF